MKDLSHRATLLIRFGYGGAGFFGLQPQPGLPTAGGALIERLTRACGQPPRGVAFAARTDRGVHAGVNVATCWVPAEGADVAAIASALIGPGDDGLVVLAVDRVLPTTHARNVSVGKHYRYIVRDNASEVDAAGEHAHAWAVVPALDVGRMRIAAQALVGTHDFTSLRGGGCSAATPIKNITALGVARGQDGAVVVDVRGDAFLRHMVRNLAGLLVEVGSGWRSASSMGSVLAALDRRAAGLMAPPGGLTLVEVVLRADVGVAKVGLAAV